MIGAYTSMQGSVFWMAPEVVSQKKGYNSKVDIWSVGCVVFEMWTGERPWSGQEAVAVLLQVCFHFANCRATITDIPIQLYQSKLGPPLPGDVVLSPEAGDLRKRCFAMNPSERPTAAELRQHPYLLLPHDWEFTGYT
jgi:serine/threonine protein kinase